MSTPASLVDVEDVRAAVDGHLADHLERLRQELAEHGSDLDPLLEAMGSMLSGGKRLRAAFCYWSWRAHGGDPTTGTPGTATAEQVLRTGAALELFQAAALFHDDVMDASDVRRGLPAAHRTFETLHRDRRWSGDPTRFGESAAILLGDLALIACDRELTRAVSGTADHVRATTREVFDRMRTEVTVGQYLDVLAQALPWGTDPAADEARARGVVRAKSARYSVQHPLSLGAALAGADRSAMVRCRELGLPLGEAFQLRDDLLGVYGDPGETGKPAGDDLREGKRTVLVARAMAGGDPPTRALLDATLGRRDLGVEDVEAVREALRATGAVESVEGLISELAVPALDALAASDLTEPGRTMLVRLGRAAVDRTA